VLDTLPIYKLEDVIFLKQIIYEDSLSVAVIFDYWHSQIKGINCYFSFRRQSLGIFTVICFLTFPAKGSIIITISGKGNFETSFINGHNYIIKETEA